MSESLLSVGIDLGTTTTQLIVSRLWVENTSEPFSVPRMEITGREILYRSPIHFTPLLNDARIDADGLRRIVNGEYQQAGINPADVQTGAVIITGETARKDNAAQVLSALSRYAGEFVVATAGPALESVLAARGAGADRLAKQEGRYVLHFDIGGGTSNMALFDPDGELADTGCLNVGGRLMKFRPDGSISYISPVLRAIETSDPQAVVAVLVQALEEAAGLRPEMNVLSHFITDKTVKLPPEQPIFSFSGGVADLIEAEEADLFRYGDLGVLLGKAIGESKFGKVGYHLGAETIRATVIGAGTHTTELSGSTICCIHAQLPIHDLPVAAIDGLSAEQIRGKLRTFEENTAALFLRGDKLMDFESLTMQARIISDAVTPLGTQLVVVLEQDLAKAMGNALRLQLGSDASIICIDGISIRENSYLDLAEPVGNGTALPVVIKTLAFI